MDTHPDIVLHAIDRTEWEAVEDLYAPASLEDEGFIHFSTLEQMVPTLNRFYVGRTNLNLLVVRTEHLPVPLQWDRAVDVDEDFPHLYQPLPREAISHVVPVLPGPDGRFEGPIDLNG